MRYPFGPFPMRGPMRWPQGNQLATIVTINLEYWDLLKESSVLDYAVLPRGLAGFVSRKYSRFYPISLDANTVNVWATGA